MVQGGARPMSFASYVRLPRHPAYKFEYWDGQLRITPRWNSHAMFLPLRSAEEVVFPDADMRVLSGRYKPATGMCCRRCCRLRLRIRRRWA